MKIVIICIFGIESVVVKELLALGYSSPRVSNGRVSIEGDLTDVARCNLWLRTAERIYIETGSFRATDFDMLFDGIFSIDWKALLPADAEIPVRSSSIDSKLFSTRDCQSITKKAIVEKLKKSYGINRIEENGKTFQIEVFIHNDIVSVCLDTTGTGLHKRGYRTLNVEAPLKETIASALLQISYWKPGRVLMDPFCGSGTFIIEAAMIAGNIAPGINRVFSFESWTGENEIISGRLKEEAREKEKQVKEILLFGSDISKDNIEIAKKHAMQAGVSGSSEFVVSDFKNIQKRGEYGIMIANPPYGLRLSDKSEIISLYKNLGTKMKEFDTWSKYILTDDDGFEKNSGCRASKKRKIYNGTIRCTYYQFFGPQPGKC
ncbi:MAG: class I SAM-dependent RNA methyltransferase [Clostridia bacterium]|nr:class I SAM-dependent RNA methyltransferase [Clostridia bacterium]MBN2882327.1 class I SAM-dependent RNA methyltransferase [Clostridia bacterium]